MVLIRCGAKAETLTGHSANVRHSERSVAINMMVYNLKSQRIIEGSAVLWKKLDANQLLKYEAHQVGSGQLW